MSHYKTPLVCRLFGHLWGLVDVGYWRCEDKDCKAETDYMLLQGSGTRATPGRYHQGYPRKDP